MRVIAVDPGYEKMGIAILEKNGSRETLLFSECFYTARTLPPSLRLRSLGEEIAHLIDQYRPTSLAIEKLFLTSNQKTVMLVAEARGVIIYEATRAGLSITEYSPPEVKVAVTGHGRSTKSQIIFMVEKLIPTNKKIKEDDEYDAIALGITYFATAGARRVKEM